MPQIGFVHRGLESSWKRATTTSSSMSPSASAASAPSGHSMGYAETVEQLMGVEGFPTGRPALRVMWHELAYPLACPNGSGLAADAFGFESVHALLAPARARLLDLFEKTTGGRVILSVVKVGGVVRDVDDAMFAYIKQVLEGLKDEYRQIMNTLLTDTSVKNRMVGVGYVSHDDAVAQKHGRPVRPRFRA